MDNFDLRKFLTENKLTTNSQLNEGLFSKSEPSDTFEGGTKEDFLKWARSVFKKTDIPSEKYEYWLDNVDSSPNEWDNSYKGVSQDELINVHLKAWFKNIKESKPLKENTFKVGQKVTYLGHPAVVTATKEYNGRNFVSVSYDKGTGKTKASDILATSGDVKPVNEEVGELESIKAKLEADPKNEYLNFIHEPERDRIRVGGKEGAKHDFVLRNEKEDFGSYELFNIDDDDRGLIVHISRKK